MNLQGLAEANPTKTVGGDQASGGHKQSTISTRGCPCQLGDPQQSPSDGVAQSADTYVLRALEAGSPRSGSAGRLPLRPRSVVCRWLSPPCVLTRWGVGKRDRQRQKRKLSGVSPQKDTNPTVLLFHPMSSFNLN